MTSRRSFFRQLAGLALAPFAASKVKAKPYEPSFKVMNTWGDGRIYDQFCDRAMLEIREKGFVSRILVYNRALTPAEVKHNYLRLSL